MKLLTIGISLLCTTVFMGTAQLPAYEYVPYQSEARNKTIALPDFSVALKKRYIEEKAMYNKAATIFVVSDIEGEYEAFKQLLKAAGVIDNNSNWTFGKGHLVIAGDVFDRGDKVTECLWLIYHLEEKAKKAGGYVHYILGNHEIMNLTNDLRYLHPKYLELAKQYTIPYTSFYSAQTELGRWLRTKNIMEKVGDVLFMHGGVSANVNELGQPIDFLNNAVRPYYADTSATIPLVAQLLLDDQGPLWYRGYFMSSPTSLAQIDSTLELFNVKKIIIGHTPVESITAFYGGKVINTDVAHAKGKSEGLLIENKKYYKVAANGMKTLVIEN